MNTETLKIEIPKGFEVDSFNETTGEIKFRQKPKPVMERIKTFDDVLQELGINKSQFDISCLELTPDEKAYRQVKLITKALNEGWTPDWTDSSQCKYVPWFDMDNSSAPSGFSYGDFDDWASYSFVGSRLCFKSSKLATYAGTQFIDIYREFFILK